MMLSNAMLKLAYAKNFSDQNILLIEREPFWFIVRLWRDIFIYGHATICRGFEEVALLCCLQYQNKQRNRQVEDRYARCSAFLLK